MKLLNLSNTLDTSAVNRPLKFETECIQTREISCTCILVACVNCRCVNGDRIINNKF